MFALLKRTKPYEKEARAIYASALNHIREPSFYTEYGVPDTFDGRFDLLVLHLFLVIDRMKNETGIGGILNQAVFDVTFADMDQTIREMGIGDMGVPKHMRRMMKAFNGRLHAYSESVEKGFLRTALLRNLYGTCDIQPLRQSELMEAYVRASIRALKGQSVETLLGGQNLFIRN